MRNRGVKYKLFEIIISFLKINPVIYGYYKIGIMNWETDSLSGEKYLLEVELKKWLLPKENYVFFDVGANKGNYTSALLRNYPNAVIHAFEPLPDCFRHLKTLFNNENAHIRLNNSCVSNKTGVMEFYTNSNDTQSEHASIYSDVLKDIHHYSHTQKFEVNAITLNDYSEKNGIAHIDFLKIDTEGHEYSVLSGASSLIESKKVSIIQFEFNEMNIVSRVFFKDFYDMLSPNYNIYRLLPEGLLPIKKYDSLLEIFTFQNFLAILK